MSHNDDMVARTFELAEAVVTMSTVPLVSRDVEGALRDRDGSCRDLNFEHPTWEGTRRLVEHAVMDFGRLAEGYDRREAMFAAIRRVEQEADDLAQFLFNEGQRFVRHLQILVARENDGSPFVELTFFPEDVCVHVDLAPSFQAWLERWCRLLSATRYYARYENAAWRFGDLGPQSGVFLASGADR